MAGVGTSCAPPAEDIDAAIDVSPVFITGYEGLSTSRINTIASYQSDWLEPIDPADPSRGDGHCCVLTVVSTADAALQLHLRDPHTRSNHSLEQFDPAGFGVAAKETLNDTGRPVLFSPALRERLTQGQGLFWTVAQQQRNATVEQQVAVVIPEDLLSARTRLEAYSATDSTGNPLGADRIELVRGFLYAATLGDSITWGNGLPLNDKFPMQVMDRIESDTGHRVIHQMMAVSGARIVPRNNDEICPAGCFREAPAIQTSLTLQLDLIEHPDVVDLLLIQGCINDVGLPTLMDVSIPEDELNKLILRFCRDEMASLMEKARRQLPRADIVLIGYYPPYSEQSAIKETAIWNQAQGFQEHGVQEEVLARQVANSQRLVDIAHPAFIEAVDRINAEVEGTPVAVFSAPPFGPEHAMFAPQSWLWGLTSTVPDLPGVDFGLELFPEDPRLRARTIECLTNPTATPGPACLYVSVGHPNFDGAEAYAESIIQSLYDIGFLP